MKTINIILQAYIPKSLGKPLLSYFSGNPLFNPRILSNYTSFKKELESQDKGGFTWLPEPGNIVSNFFCGTDDSGFHDKKHGDHNVRLSIPIKIELGKIGRYSSLDINNIFIHPQHSNLKDKLFNGKQHSGLSHRVKAYIKRISFNMDSPRSSSKDVYMGIFEKSPSIFSEEENLKTEISNTYTGFYFTKKGLTPEYDTTVIKAVASAPYPYLKYVAPNIDMEVTIKIYRNPSSKSVSLKVEGVHNKFPAYELLIDNEVAYSYFPKGYSGPTPINLNQNINFSASRYITLSDWDLRELNQPKVQSLFKINVK